MNNNKQSGTLQGISTREIHFCHHSTVRVYSTTQRWELLQQLTAHIPSQSAQWNTETEFKCTVVDENLPFTVQYMSIPLQNLLL